MSEKLTLLSLEGELGTWLKVVFGVTTSGLFFYNMARTNSKFMTRPLAASIAIIFLCTGVIYIFFSLYNFHTRTEKILHIAKKVNNNDDNADDINTSDIYNSRAVYTFTSCIVGLTLILICIQISYNTFKYIYRH